MIWCVLQLLVAILAFAVRVRSRLRTITTRRYHHRAPVWLYLSVSVRVWPCLYTPLPPPSPAHTFCTFRAPLKRWLRPPYEKEETLARRLAKTRALPRCTDCATNVHVSSHETICRARRTDRMVTWPRTGRTHRRKTPFLNESAPEQRSVRIGALARAYGCN